MLPSYRRDDAVLLLSQNNAEQRVEILGANQRAQDLLGFDEATLKHKPFSAILPERIANLLREYVEYDPRGNDVATVLGRTRDFHILDAKGNPRPFFPKLIPADADEGITNFHLLLQPRAGASRAAELRDFIKNVLPQSPGLPARQQWLRQIEAWQEAPEDKRAPSCLAILEVDQKAEILEWQGQRALDELTSYVATYMRQKLRAYDDVTIVDDQLALMLLDVGDEAARLVLNRLRWELCSLPVQLPIAGRLSFTLSASYSVLDAQKPAEMQWNACEASLEKHRALGQGQLSAVA